MKINVESRDFSKTVNLKGRTLADLYSQLGLLSESFIASRGGELIPESEPLREGDRLKLYPAISGG